MCDPITVNVKLCGAIGDGVADDTTAIQNAIDAVAVTGGVVYFPPGEYFMDTPHSLMTPYGEQGYHVLLKSGVMLAGAGRGVSIIVSQREATNAILAFQVDNFGVRNLTVQVNNAVWADGIKFLSCGFATLENVECIGGAYPFQLLGNRCVQLSNCLARDADWPGGNGFSFGTWQADDSWLSVIQAVNCYSQGNDRSGFILVDQTERLRATLTNCHSLNNGIGFELYKTRYAQLVGCHAERNGGMGFNLGGSSRNTLLNCTALNNSQQGLYSRCGFAFTSDGRLSSDGNLVQACRATDDQDIKTQQSGIVLLDSADRNRFVGCDLEGNAAAAVVFMTTGQQNSFLSCAGYVGS